MIKRYHIFLILLCWIGPLAGISQPGTVNSTGTVFKAERTLLHTDRPLYISGETIWFKMYVLEARRHTLSYFSNVGYLELISPEGTAVSRVKVRLEEGNGSGTIKLPQGLNSGAYTLRSYTQAMRNSGEVAFGKASLIILNPTQPIVRPSGEEREGFSPAVSEQASLAVADDQYLRISVQPSQTTVPQRGMARLEINTTNADGQPVSAQLSLAVALKSPATNGNAGLFQQRGDDRSTSFTGVPSTISFLPETDGMRLSGEVINQNTRKGEPKVTVFLAFPGKTALVYAAVTNEYGQFSFLLPKLFGLRPIVLQVGPNTTVPVTIQLDEAFHEIPVTIPEPFVLPQSWVPMANAAMVNAQLGQAYRSFEVPPVYATPNLFDSIPFFGQPDVRYVLDEYTRFPLPEFFFEVPTEVWVRGKYGSEQLRVSNEWQSPGADLPPLLLVDGVPVFDQRTFLKINNQLIASTEIVTAPFWLNPVLFDGIIQLTSFEEDARCFQLPETALRRSFLTLLPEREFAAPDYEGLPDRRLPDFRNTLYWNPLIQTDQEGKATVEFFTSDAIGDYTIHIEGVANGRLVGSGRGEIGVVKRGS